MAVDPSSLDFERLTRLEFEGQDVELVDMNYLTTIRAMQAGTIDAAILDVEDALMRFPADIGSRPLSPGGAGRSGGCEYPGRLRVPSRRRRRPGARPGVPRSDAPAGGPARR